MNDFIGNDLCTEIIAQYINEVKEARGDSFSEDDINLAEIGRRTGISRGRLRKFKKNGFVVNGKPSVPRIKANQVGKS